MNVPHLGVSCWLVAGLLAVATPSPAQNAKPQPAAAEKLDPAKLEKEDKEVAQRCASILMRFADSCRSSKLGPRAKEAYDRILKWYDPDHAGARQALGFKKTKDGWQEQKPMPLWKDKSNDENRYKAVADWVSTSKSLANVHRERGLKLIKENSENPALGVYHLRCAVAYNPFDKEANLALGNEEFKAADGNTYYGTAEEISFIKHMREVETTALMLAKKEYEVQPVNELPKEIAALDLEFHGAKSKHFTVFTRGTQENADNIAKWGERSLDFLEYCLGAELAKKLHIRERQKQFAFHAFVWTATEKKKFMEQNLQLLPDKDAVHRADSFMNIQWGTQKGVCNLVERLTPAMMHDYIVFRAWKTALDETNDIVAEGAVHAATWYLLATCITRSGALPDKSETESGPELNLPESANWWLREMRDQAQGGTDFPVNQLPRIKVSKFPNDVRLKTWSFMTWLIARYPDKWYAYLRAVPANKLPFPEEVDACAEKVFERKLGDIEAEWREWAAGRGAVAAATGYGPPLLPEKPNAAEIAAVKRINQLRAIATLEPCEIDAESSQACEAHAHFLNLHGEKFRKWPEAHEEDPALEGFSPRGMRAGLNSVIVFGESNAADSIDGWIGTFYHRLPLLEPHTRRIGMAVEGDICVLDMGSLQDPYEPKKGERGVPWPFKNQKDVPVHFFGNEFPNPVEEVAPKDKQSNPALGYPVTLQLEKNVAKQVADGTIELFEIRKGIRWESKFKEPSLQLNEEGVPKEAKKVECYVHTPAVPMLKRMEVKDCLCAIPKEHLKPQMSYLVKVVLKFGGGDETYLWKFTTGVN